MIRWLSTLVLSLGFAAAALAGPAASGPIGPQSFRDRLAAAVTQATGQSTSIVDDRTLKTKSADGVEFTLSIDNVYAAYTATPERLDDLITRYVATLAQRAGGETLDQLVVVVRPSDYVTRSLPPGSSQTSFVAPRQMAGDLSYFLAVDSPTATRTAEKRDLVRWRIDDAEAWRRAAANIKARVGALQPIRIGDENGAVGFGAESGLAPSILADPAVCGPDAPNGLDGQIVFVAARDFFLYANPRDSTMLRAFWAAVREGTEGKKAISATALTCRAGKWITVPTPP